MYPIQDCRQLIHGVISEIFPSLIFAGKNGSARDCLEIETKSAFPVAVFFNVFPVSAVRLVKIKKESKSTVTTGNKADRSNTSEYKRSPGTRDAASTPKTGDSFDEKWIFALLAASLGGSFIYWKKKKKH